MDHGWFWVKNQISVTGRDWSCRYNDRKIQRLTERDGQKG